MYLLFNYNNFIFLRPKKSIKKKGKRRRTWRVFGKSKGKEMEVMVYGEKENKKKGNKVYWENGNKNQIEEMDGVQERKVTKR